MSIVAALIAFSAVGVACRSGGAPSSGLSASRAPAEACPFTPARVRLHPLTRMLPGTSDERPARLDAHVELLDQWGVPVRALGELRFVARFAQTDAAAVAATDPDFSGVVIWTIDLTDPEANATQFYDRVTRTYHIVLSDPALAQVASPLTLDVVFLAPGAATLPATMRVDPARQSE